MLTQFIDARMVRIQLGRSGRLLVFAAGVAVLMQAQLAHAQAGNCGPLENGYGPYDYRTDKDKLPIVLTAHFTPAVEELIRGNTGTIGGDIDYTLRAIPNNPRALMSMMKLGAREKTQQPRGSRYTVECWFDRALRFRPDDNVVRMIFSTFLTSNNRKAEAMEHLETVRKAAGDNPFTHFNLGLVYFDMNEPEKALVQAHKAMELGFPRTELRDRLQAAGKWKDPMPSAPAEAAAAADPNAAASAPQKP